jgi:hypothetical protein
MKMLKILHALQTAFGCIYCGIICLLVPFLPVGQLKFIPWLDRTLAYVIEATVVNFSLLFT